MSAPLNMAFLISTHLMVYFGNLGPCVDAMGKWGPIEDVMINGTP